MNAFTSDPAGCNPAGVRAGSDLPDPETAQRIAHDVGYSATAFLTHARTVIAGHFRHGFAHPVERPPPREADLGSWPESTHRGTHPHGPQMSAIDDVIAPLAAATAARSSPADSAMAMPATLRERGMGQRPTVRTAGPRYGTHTDVPTRMGVIDDIIAPLAARQHGLVTRQQLLAAGISPDTIRSRVRARRLVSVHRGVYRVGPVVAPGSREIAAVLACGEGAVVSHHSAAALWERTPQPDGAPVDVSVPGANRGRRPGLRMHRVRSLPPDEVTTLDAIPITTPARTILDLAAVAPTRRVEQALARALRDALATPADVLGLIARHPRRPGAPLLRALLERDVGPAFTRSEAEERFLALVRKAGLPEPELNVIVGGHEVDFLWRRERLVVEVDGFEFHSSRDRFERDRRRDADLFGLGLRVVRVTWRQITKEPEATLVRVTRALFASAPESAVLLEPLPRGQGRERRPTYGPHGRGAQGPSRGRQRGDGR